MRNAAASLDQIRDYIAAHVRPDMHTSIKGARASYYAQPPSRHCCYRHPQDAAVLAPLIEQEILWRLLTGPHGDVVRQIGLADSDLALIGRVIAWIRDNYAEPMRVEDLARLSGMSPSGFHRHFRAVTAMSPLQFQKRIRLQHARSILVAHPGDIAGVGHLVGYDSPSQFNREYRRPFGSPPGRGAERVRTSDGVAQAGPFP